MSTFEGFNKHYHEELEEEIAVVKNTLCKGNADTFEEYKRLCGKLDGLKFCLERHIELLDLMEKA